MKIETEHLEDRQVQLTVELDDDRLNRSMRSAAKRLARNSNVSGFRPGKAPYEVLLRKFGEDMIFEEALEDLGQELYREALEEAEIEPYAPGTLEEVVNREPLTLRYIVPLAPKIDLGVYQEIRLPYEEPEIDDEAVNQVMENLRKRQALIEPVERPAAMGDIVVVDIEALIYPDQGEEDQPLLNDKDVSILVDEETNWPFPGISEFLIDLKAGDVKTIEYTFPEDYANESMRGEEATFEIYCLEVKSRLVPEWSDDLAKAIGNYESMLDLRISVRNELMEEAKRQAETNHGRTLVDKLVEGSTITYPPFLLQEELHSMLRELESRLRVQSLSLDDYLKIENKTEEELMEELKPSAEARLKRALVLGELVTAEKIEVSDSDVDAEIDRIMEHFQEKSVQTRELFNTPDSRRRLTLDLLSDKAIERLIAIAAGKAEEQIETELEPEDASRTNEERLEVNAEPAMETSKQDSEPNQEIADIITETERNQAASSSAPESIEE